MEIKILSKLNILPKAVIPNHYDISLDVDFDSFKFEGSEDIQIEILKPVSEIVLNSVDLEIINASFLSDQDLDLSKPKITLNNEYLKIDFGQQIPACTGVLKIDFYGTLSDDLKGFYKASYKDEDDSVKYLATTQFEATDARRAFPCWDEPAFKATFNLSLSVPNEFSAVSNMQIVSEIKSPKPNTKIVKFEKTPPMSTYYLAFIIGDLGSIERETEFGTLIRVWTTAGKEKQGEYALDVAEKLLKFFNQYFGIKYPLQKLDHLAIPDFAAGAMENWGAITYRENALLVDPENSSVATKQIVASIISHEMAHMWFGDLVTMSWWNDLWLNESFASWMGDKAVDSIFPEWKVWSQFVSQDTNQALQLDGLKNSHPINQEVNDPSEIGQLFDAISYSKGGSVLRMLETFLGEETFRLGIVDYLNEHQYSNAEGKDLWRSLDKVSGKPVSEMMDKWINQTGYPVVEVDISKADKNIISMNQERFLYEKILGGEDSEDTTWDIPISIISSKQSSPETVLMREKSLDFNFKNFSNSNWFKLNSDQASFIRVNYPEDALKQIESGILSGNLSDIDRLGIQNDCFALSVAGYFPGSRYLSLLKAYTDETDAIVWSDLASNLNSINSLLEDTAINEAFNKYACDLFQKIGTHVGWESKSTDNHLDILLRSIVLGQLGDYGDKKTIEKGVTLYEDFKNDLSSIDPNIRKVVLTLAAKSGSKDTFDEMWDLYDKELFEEEKTRILSALTCFNQTDLLLDLLDRSLDKDKVRLHNCIGVVTGVSFNRTGKKLAWEFLKDNWSEFDKRYGKGGFGLMRLVSITKRFSTQNEYDDVMQFFKNNPVPAAERTVRQSLEKIKINVAWLDKNIKEIKKLLGD